MQGKGLNTAFSTEVKWLGVSSVLKMVSFQWRFDQCHVKYVKINRCLQLGVDGVVDTDVECTLGSKSYILRTVFFLLLFTSLSYKNPTKYFEWRWQSDFGVSFLVTAVMYFLVIFTNWYVQTLCAERPSVQSVRSGTSIAIAIGNPSMWYKYIQENLLMTSTPPTHPPVGTDYVS